MNITKTTFRQHEELRVPQGWTDQEKTLVAQIERLMDDLFNRFGRIKLSDLGEALRNQIAADESNIGDLQSRMADAEGDIDDLEANTVTSVDYDAVNKKLTVTINNVTDDIVTLATMKSDMALDNVENKSSATIRSEITSSNVNVQYDSVNMKLTLTINGTTTDIVTLAAMKAAMALDNVENKSSATIRGELTSGNVTTALGYTPLRPGVTWGQLKNV